MADRFAITAGTVVPLNAPPILDGAVVVKDGKIESVTTRSEIDPNIPSEEFTSGILLPTFVNAHTHLVYSGWRGLADNEPFFDWLISNLIPLGIDQRDEECIDNARLGISQLFRNGITAIAECHYLPWGHQAMVEMGMKGVWFHEIFGLRTLDLSSGIVKLRATIEKLAASATNHQRFGISPHSPYSCPPVMLKMAREVSSNLDLPLSIHVAETHEEIRFFLHGDGPFANARAYARFPQSDRNSTPLEYIDKHGLLTPKTILVHGLHLSDSDLGIISNRGCTIVTCPTSNAKLGSGIARATAWKSHGIPICIGTDSLASTESFNLFEEMRRFVLFQRGLTSECGSFTAEEVIRMVTTTPAEALGMSDIVGDLKVGSSADFMVVDPDKTGISENRDIYQTLLWGTDAIDIVKVWADGLEVFTR